MDHVVNVIDKAGTAQHMDLHCRPGLCGLDQDHRHMDDWLLNTDVMEA